VFNNFIPTIAKSLEPKVARGCKQLTNLETRLRNFLWPNRNLVNSWQQVTTIGLPILLDRDGPARAYWLVFCAPTNVAKEADHDPKATRTQIPECIVAASINQDRADAEVLDVTQTPTFFVNGRHLSSFGEAELRALVNEEVASSRM